MIKKTLLAVLLSSASLSAVSAPLPDASPLFSLKTSAEVLKESGASASKSSHGLSFTAPIIAESPTSVPLKITVAKELRAVRLLVIADKNPVPLVAVINGELSGVIDLRIRLKESTDVRVVAILPDGSSVAESRMVKVTIGGCGG